MKCRDCPYGKYDFKNMITKDNILHGVTEADALYKASSEYATEEIEKFILCEKVGGVVYYVGHCGDWSETNNKVSKKYCKKKSMHKYERYLKHKDKMKNLYETIKNRRRRPDPVWIECRDSKVLKSYYKRYYRDRTSKYLKQQSNKTIRRHKTELYKGNQCHKLYDFWWEYS